MPLLPDQADCLHFHVDNSLLAEVGIIRYDVFEGRIEHPAWLLTVINELRGRFQ